MERSGNDLPNGPVQHGTSNQSGAEGSQWERNAHEAITELLNAHAALDRKRLHRALNGLAILVDWKA